MRLLFKRVSRCEGCLVSCPRRRRSKWQRSCLQAMDQLKNCEPKETHCTIVCSPLVIHVRYKLVILVLPCGKVLRAESAPDRRRRVGVPATVPGAASCSPSTEAATDGGLLAVDPASICSPELSTARSSCASMRHNTQHSTVLACELCISKTARVVPRRGCCVCAPANR